MLTWSYLRPCAWLSCALAVGACSGEIGEVETGVLSLQLQPSAAVQLGLLKYTVSHERGFVRSGPVALGEEQVFTFEVDSLPPAYGYVVTAYAEGTIKAVGAPTVCTGEANFEVRAAQATAVSMRLQCEGVARTGTEHGDEVNSCPTVGVISAEPARVPVGEYVRLRAEAAPDDDGPLPIEYHWSADSATLSNPSSAETRMLCKRPGVVAVQLTLSDGDDGCVEAPATVYVTCTGDTCTDLTHCTNSPARPTTGQSSSAGRGGAPAAQAGAAGRQGSAGSTAKPVDQDAGAAQAGRGATNPWPPPIDNNPERGPQGRRNRSYAGQGGQTHSSGGAVASAGETAPQPQAGAASLGGIGGVEQAGSGGSMSTAGSGADLDAGFDAGAEADAGADAGADSGAGAGGAGAGGAGGASAGGAGAGGAGAGAGGAGAGGASGAGACSGDSFDDCCRATGLASALPTTCTDASFDNTGNL